MVVKNGNTAHVNVFERLYLPKYAMQTCFTNYCLDVAYQPQHQQSYHQGDQRLHMFPKTLDPCREMVLHRQEDKEEGEVGREEGEEEGEWEWYNQTTPEVRLQLHHQR